jgi:hypothetical protein
MLLLNPSIPSVVCHRVGITMTLATKGQRTVALGYVKVPDELFPTAVDESLTGLEHKLRSQKQRTDPKTGREHPLKSRKKRLPALPLLFAERNIVKSTGISRSGCPSQLCYTF